MITGGGQLGGGPRPQAITRLHRVAIFLPFFPAFLSGLGQWGADIGHIYSDNKIETTVLKSTADLARQLWNVYVVK